MRKTSHGAHPRVSPAVGQRAKNKSHSSTHRALLYQKATRITYLCFIFGLKDSKCLIQSDSVLQKDGQGLIHSFDSVRRKKSRIDQQVLSIQPCALLLLRCRINTDYVYTM